MVENQQPMIAGAVLVTVPDAVFLFAMRRAHARIPVEQDTSRRTPTINAVNPLAGKISRDDEQTLRRHERANPIDRRIGIFEGAEPRDVAWKHAEDFSHASMRLFATV